MHQPCHTCVQQGLLGRHHHRCLLLSTLLFVYTILGLAPDTTCLGIPGKSFVKAPGQKDARGTRQAVLAAVRRATGTLVCLLSVPLFVVVLKWTPAGKPQLFLGGQILKLEDGTFRGAKSSKRRQTHERRRNQWHAQRPGVDVLARCVEVPCQAGAARCVFC